LKTSSCDIFRGGHARNDWTPDTCATLKGSAGATLRPGGLELTEHLLAWGNFQTGSRILDAGCGMGATLRHLSQSCRHSAVGVDSSAAMLEEARNSSGDVTLLCAGLERLPFGDESFDGIICECVLSRTDTAAVLVEFSRVLCKDGMLLVSDLYRQPERLNPAGGRVTDNPLATRKQTEKLMEDAGFTVEHWEDRTSALRQLAVRLIMSPGAAGENLFGWDVPGEFRSLENGVGCHELGYHLLAARRKA
jgi:arsenite methyltransferase